MEAKKKKKKWGEQGRREKQKDEMEIKAEIITIL
jgi:hypothetical protein